MSLRRLIQHNFWLKLFSLLMATMLWFAVSSIQKQPDRVPGFETGLQRRTFEKLPVAVLKKPMDPELYTVSPEHTDVTVEGPREVLESLTTRDLEIFINLANRSFESSVYQVHAHVLAEVEVVDISPRTVRVKRFSP
ncbi:MAG: hypothetical protein CMO80_17245 [Verrucomicrobiales bacterium]|nr:hypothetical protein [Verrucomicrobiales bacterium]|tara:strand:- start:4570 stop:4980 length:411 start_codon:yes stop_codon:yes gene_type:complete